ncbi:MAG: ribonuclease Z, partial [Candidatus Altarchaeaceae archaeon]
SYGYVFEEKEKRKFLKEKALALGIPEGPLYSKLQRGETINFKGKIITPDEVLSDPIKGRKIVYTGDTIPCENVIKFSKDADVLIFDSSYSHQDIEKVSDHLHSTASQAAEIALKANVKSLYLVHISQRYKNTKILEEEARKIFKNTYVAKDFLTVKITPPPEKEILNIETRKRN